MRIHTDKMAEVRRAINAATRQLPGVYHGPMPEHGSRSRKGALELRLTGNGRTGGQWGNTTAKSATFDEWGVILAAVYAADPDAICGTAKRPVYAGSNDFHWQTGERFAHVGVALAAGDRVLPEDTHALHRWDYVAQGTRECRKCSATSHAPLRG